MHTSIATKYLYSRKYYILKFDGYELKQISTFSSLWNFEKVTERDTLKLLEHSRERYAQMFTLLQLIITTTQPFAYIERCVWYIALLLIQAPRILGFWILSRNTT